MYTVIIADDEQELREAIVSQVDWTAIGFEVVGQAENGIEALELVERLQADLLLTDIKMPFISGIELARQVREIRPAMHIAFLSGYDDFRYAQQAIQYNIISYLVKPLSRSEMTEALVDIRQKMDNKNEAFRKSNGDAAEKRAEAFLMPLLLDGVGASQFAEKEQELCIQAQALGLLRGENDCPHFFVLVMCLQDKTGANCTLPRHVYSVNMILQKYVRYGSFYSNGRVVSLIAENSFELSEYLHILLSEIVQSMERLLHRRCFIGVSREVESLQKCATAYHEAAAALSYSDDAGTVHYITDMEHSSTFEYEFIQQSIQTLESLLKLGGADKLEAFIDRLFSGLESVRPTKSDLNLLMIQIIATVCQSVGAVSDSGAADAFMAQLPMRDNLFVYSTAKEAKEGLLRLCLKAREIIADQHKQNSEIICDKAIEIISNRYAEEGLTLVSLSEELHVSPNYLSALMKKIKGDTFTNLLTARRMDAARNYLLCSSMKIAEISARCGYSDQHYFSYCYKKFFGLSPNKMREQAAGRASGEGRV